MPTRIIKPLKQQKKKKPPLINPREAWVLEKPDGYVLRRRRSVDDVRSKGGPVWWESEMITVELAREAARTRQVVEGGYMFYAVRSDEFGDKRIALVLRESLLT